MIRHETRTRARYAETDQMGVVYYANYLVWMEIGRTELCRAIGVRYADLERDDDILFAVAEAKCRYLLPARYDDEICIAAWVSKAHRRMMEFSYEITSGGAAIARGSTVHIFLNRQYKAVSLPAKYHAAFGIS